MLKMCTRCRGNKKMYLINGGYTSADFGGKQVDCPCCLGTGRMKSNDEVLKQLDEEKLEETSVITKKKSSAKKEQQTTVL